MGYMGIFLISPKPYSIYLRGTIYLGVLYGSKGLWGLGLISFVQLHMDDRVWGSGVRVYRVLRCRD